MIALNNYINGREVRSTARATTTIVDPVTGNAYATAPKSNAADLDAAFRAATDAFKTWKETTPAERQLLLLKIADALMDHKDELAAAECQNCGKPRQLTIDEELQQGADQIRFFAGACRVLEGKSAGCYMRGMLSLIVREPVGVCAAVTPWNYPLLMAVWKWAPALAAGNTMVLKPAEATPVSTLLMARIMGEILPAGVFNVVCGERETGELMVGHPTPAMVSITGSVRAGRQVAEGAAAGLKRVHLELGGKAPVVVFADADLATAAADIALAGFFNAGQDCTAATRVTIRSASRSASPRSPSSTRWSATLSAGAGGGGGGSGAGGGAPADSMTTAPSSTRACCPSASSSAAKPSLPTLTTGKERPKSSSPTMEPSAMISSGSRSTIAAGARSARSSSRITWLPVASTASHCSS